MSGKNIAIVSYLTFIGWIIALVSHNDSSTKESLASFHIRQSLGIMITGFILTTIPPLMGAAFASQIAGVLVLILWIIGFVSAVQGKEKEVPVLGKYYQDWLKGIN